MANAPDLLDRIGALIKSGRYRLRLHAVRHLVVCDYSDVEILDIVTAYIPQAPWWVTPSRRGKGR